MATQIDLSFRAEWRAEVLGARPLILPGRNYVYPARVEEVERGALEVLVWPSGPDDAPKSEVTESLSSPVAGPKRPPSAKEFLTTCALGFADPVVPTGVWACPNARELAAVAGGYAYLIDTLQPERFTFLALRPVMQVLAAPQAGLLLFAGHRTVAAWGREGLAWESEKLSDEGLTGLRVEGGRLRGLGWEMIPDREREFVVELAGGWKVG